VFHAVSGVVLGQGEILSRYSLVYLFVCFSFRMITGKFLCSHAEISQMYPSGLHLYWFQYQKTGYLPSRPDEGDMNSIQAEPQKSPIRIATGTNCG